MQSPVADAFPPRPIALPKFLPTSGSNQRNQSHPHPSGPQSHHSTPHHLRPDKSGRTSTIREIWYRQPTALPHTRSSQHNFPHLCSVSYHSPPLRPQLTKFSWVSFPPRQRRHHYHAPSIHEHITKTPITFSAPTHPPSFITPFHPRIPQPGRKIMDTITQYLRWSAPAISFYP